MTSNTFLSIACGALVWVLGVSCYLASFYLPVLENPEEQSNTVLVLALVPSAYLGTYLFYKKGQMKSASLALIFILVAALLDALITVPVFIIPAGGNHAEFFSDPMFYVIVVEFYFIVFFFGKYLNQNIKK